MDKLFVLLSTESEGIEGILDFGFFKDVGAAKRCFSNLYELEPKQYQINEYVLKSTNFIKGGS